MKRRFFIIVLSTMCAALVAMGEEFELFGRPRVGYPVTHIGYELGYKSFDRCALWVAYRLTPAYSTGERLYKQEQLTLAEDPVIAEKALTGPTAEEVMSMQLWPLPVFSPADALGRGIECEKEAYYLSNILLQDPSKETRRLWKETEELARGWAKEFNEAWVIAGPIFPETPRRVGKDAIAVPDAFYKIVIRKDESNGVKTVTYKIPQNGTDKLDSYVTTIDAIEKDTGLDFLSDLPDDQETAVESEKTMTLSVAKEKTAVIPGSAVAGNQPAAAAPGNTGDVWVLKGKSVYYLPGGSQYGQGSGTFMGESEAQLLGFRPARK